MYFAFRGRDKRELKEKVIQREIKREKTNTYKERSKKKVGEMLKEKRIKDRHRREIYSGNRIPFSLIYSNEGPIEYN